MGQVFRAFDRVMGCGVALKPLHQLGPEPTYQLKREFRLLADLAHPNLIELYNLVADRDVGCFTMELVRGSNFVEYVRGPVERLEPEGTPGPPTQAQLERLRSALPQLAAG